MMNVYSKRVTSLEQVHRPRFLTRVHSLTLESSIVQPDHQRRRVESLPRTSGEGECVAVDVCKSTVVLSVDKHMVIPSVSQSGAQTFNGPFGLWTTVLSLVVVSPVPVLPPLKCILHLPLLLRAVSQRYLENREGVRIDDMVEGGSSWRYRHQSQGSNSNKVRRVE